MPRREDAPPGSGDGAAHGCARFAAERPALEAERAAETPLFLALETLRGRLEAALGAESNASRWMETELARFFDDALAPAVQQRESALVNDLYECFQRELEARGAKQQALADRVSECGHECAQLRAQLDRRVADTNALRKEYYKQLLMLRDMVNRQKSEPKTLSALNDAISSANTAAERGGGRTAADRSEDTGKDTRQLHALNTSQQRSEAAASPSMRREREKWEQRVHEASVESHQLQDQIAVLRHQVESLRQNEANLWFLDAKNGVSERQRVIDAVYKSKCSWEDVGGSIVELLNNEVIWEAVERTVRVKTVRASRGLEALITEIDAMNVQAAETGRRNSSAADDGVLEPGSKAAHLLRRLSSDGADRLIPCRACNGAGYISSKGGADDDDSDSYLRRTLAQVLELKALLDQTTDHSNEVEQELQTTLSCYAQLQGKMEQIEAEKRLRVEIAVQADLDDEDEEQVLNAIAENDGQRTNWASAITRKSKRVQLYERLISELKRSLTDKEAGIKELRGAVESSQARLVALQKQSQQEQQALRREVSALKTSLALSMKHRNSNIDEKQAAVKFLLKRLTSEQRQMSLRRQSTASLIEEEQELEDSEDHCSRDKRQADPDGDELDDPSSDGDSSDEELEIERSEKVARRYSESVERVQKEFLDQQARMNVIDEEIKEQEEKRKRTNSIALGNIVVTMSSHPRDLFKALSTAQGELTMIRRASQQSSTLQADRLLTLTTHLSHISEELCMVRKRTNAEIEYWRLECEKLQNANTALLVEQHELQQRVEGMRDQLASASTSASSQECYLCAKHQARLADISNWMLAQEGESVCPTSQQDGETISDPTSLMVLPAKTQDTLTEHDQRAVSGLVLEIEQVCASMNSATQEAALTLLGRAIFGKAAPPSPRVQGGKLSGSIPGMRGPDSLQDKRNSSVMLRLADSREAPPNSDQSLERQPSARIRSAPSHREVVSESRRVTTHALQSRLEPGADYSSSMIGLELIDATHLDSRPGIGGLLTVRGRAVSNASYSIGDSNELSSPERGVRMIPQHSSDASRLPSFHRKKTVKKLLSHQEFEHWRRKRQPYDIRTNDGPNESESGDSSKLDGDADPSPECASAALDDTGYAVYSDDKGQDIYCVDVEVSDDENDECEDDAALDAAAFSTRSNVPPVVPITIPRVMSIGDKLLHRGNVSPNLPVTENQHSHDISTDMINLIERSADNSDAASACSTRDDPPIIQQLRILLKLNEASRGRLAVANWELLVSLVRLGTSQSRLSTFGAEARSRGGTLSASTRVAKCRIGRMRIALEAAVHQRELALEKALAARHSAKRECRKLQSQFMHSIATMMTSLSQRSKRGGASVVDFPLSVGNYDAAPSSPGIRAGWGYNSRPVYPATQVNLGYLPPTQQLPTPTFPIGPESSSLSPATASRARLIFRDEVEQDSGTGMSTSIDSPGSDPWVHAGFPHRIIKFVGSSSPYDLSLTHSASVLTKSPSQSTCAFSSTPSKAALPLVSPSPQNAGSPSKSQMVRHPERPESARAVISASPHQKPTRPQSSPSAAHRVVSPRQREAAGFR